MNRVVLSGAYGSKLVNGLLTGEALIQGISNVIGPNIQIVEDSSEKLLVELERRTGRLRERRLVSKGETQVECVGRDPKAQKVGERFLSFGQ